MLSGCHGGSLKVNNGAVFVDGMANHPSNARSGQNAIKASVPAYFRVTRRVSSHKTQHASGYAADERSGEHVVAVRVFQANLADFRSSNNIRSAMPCETAMTDQFGVGDLHNLASPSCALQNADGRSWRELFNRFPIACLSLSRRKKATNGRGRNRQFETPHAGMLGENYTEMRL